MSKNIGQRGKRLVALCKKQDKDDVNNNQLPYCDSPLPTEASSPENWWDEVFQPHPVCASTYSKAGEKRKGQGCAMPAKRQLNGLTPHSQVALCPPARRHLDFNLGECRKKNACKATSALSGARVTGDISPLSSMVPPASHLPVSVQPTVNCTSTNQGYPAKTPCQATAVSSATVGEVSPLRYMPCSAPDLTVSVQPVNCSSTNQGYHDETPSEPEADVHGARDGEVSTLCLIAPSASELLVSQQPVNNCNTHNGNGDHSAANSIENPPSYLGDILALDQMENILLDLDVSDRSDMHYNASVLAVVEEENPDPEVIISLPAEDNSGNVNHTGTSQEVEISTVMQQENTTPSNSGRKRQCNKSKWKAAVRKVAKNTGQAHVTPKGELVSAAKMRRPCTTCRIECYNRLTEENRKLIFKHFWAIGDHTRQWDYITRHSRSTPTKKKTAGENSRRHTSRKYFFIIEEKGNEIPVCKNMFTATLGIWDGWITSAYSHIQGATGTLSPDKRGKHPNNYRATTDAQRETVRTHINKYQRVPSHYTRARSKREYLEVGLSINKMYQHYEEWCQAEAVPKSSQASARQYRTILNSEFNIGFFKPKKDQCGFCSMIKQSIRPERESFKMKYAQHIQNKNMARELHKKDVAHAASNEEIVVCCFDLQKVLTCPRSESSEFFYRNKISLYNFTVYDITKHQGFCYVWTECTAKRGANEVGSCLLLFIRSSVMNGMKEMRSTSDCCGGQNRNRFVFAIFMLAAALLNIKIVHRFMEPGHTQSEGDSMHALIEKTADRKELFNEMEWVELIKGAKQTLICNSTK